MYRNRREKFEVLRSQLEMERSSFIPHWTDLGEHILPHKLRLTSSDVNRGDRRNLKIIDSTGTLDARTLSSGMMGAITSPARPWFRLTTPDPELAEFGPVKEWLHVTANRMDTIYKRANLYRVLPGLYEDLGVFATAPMSVEEDFEDVIRCYDFPVGSYMIATDHRGRVNTFFREFPATVRQLVEKFGRKTSSGQIDWSNFSHHVKDLWDKHMLNTRIEVCHVIMPNDDYRPGSRLARHKKFLSYYYEKGTLGSSNYISSTEEDKFLRESGYDYFPILCPRWKLRGGDAYGISCPGMDSLGDIRALQVLHRRKAEAIEKMVSPPMKGSAELKTQGASLLPRKITYVLGKDSVFEPAQVVDPRILELRSDIQEHQERIHQAFYADLFLMMAYTDRRQITATEVEERHEEKLLALGPVLEQLNQDLLDPLIDITFAIMERYQNSPYPLIPPAPPELQGVQLKVEYISYMAQAQKLLGVGALERLTNFVVTLSQGNPVVRDKLDDDQMVDEYGEALGVSPKVIRSDDAVSEIREARAEAQRAEQMALQAREGAAVAKDLSQASTTGDNALSELLRQAEAGNPLPPQ